MPGLDWDLNLKPDEQPLCRRLSFSGADEPLRSSGSPRIVSVLPPIAEEDSEGTEAKTTRVRQLKRVAPPLVPESSFADPTGLLRARRSSQMLSVVPPITEDHSEGADAETPDRLPKRAAPISVPVTSSAAPYSAQGGVPRTVAKDDSEGTKAERPIQRSLKRAASPLVPVTFSTASHSAQGSMPHQITGGDSKGTKVEKPARPSESDAPPLVLVTSSATTKYSAQGGIPRPTSAAPVATTSPVPAAPTLSLQFQQQAVSAARMSEYQRQLQASMQQQAFAKATRADLVRRLLRLYTVAGVPAGYDTKWDELHPGSQRLLLRIEEKLQLYKYQSQKLEQCSRLHDPSSYKNFDIIATQITQEVGSTSTIMGREKVSIKGLTDVIKGIKWHADIALHSYVKLRQKFVQRGAGLTADYANHSGSSGSYTEFNQRMKKAPNFPCYNGAPRRPSPFIELTVARFEEQIGECFKCAEELDLLVQMKNDKSFPESLESISKVLSNVHDYFIHVANELEDFHQALEAMKIPYLNHRRYRGCWNDPFDEADTRDQLNKKPLSDWSIQHCIYHPEANK